MKIEPIQSDQATEAVRDVYQAIERRTGRVATLYKMLAHKPEVLRTFDAFYQAIWAPGALESKLKVLAYLRTSLLNGCAF